ncbi:protein MAIN-LIKE 2-like [Vicia villosa]|uniref:protein MAIN-LIKE 2-like n=1 Tax=Vicia villosa TaxID=3911 RepID=UPI00273BC1D0|nr:protein MAIN-LIKE 2-like [Vicia villosa]
MLLGLNTNGKAVFGNVQQPNALCVEMLGVDLIEGEGRQRGRGQGIKLVGLQQAYDDLKLNQFSSEESKLYKTRMYIMLLFGRFLFPEGTGNSVNFMYLCLLEDIDAIKTYSWGSTVLAYLYSFLCKCATKDSCTFNGCAFFLQAWFNATGLDYTNTPVNKIIFYCQLLDRLRPQDFIWRPYLGLDHVPEPREAAVWTAKSPIIRFDNSKQYMAGGTRPNPLDREHMLRALKALSLPTSEVNLPDGLLAVPLLCHQRIALSWMVQKETSTLSSSGGILADDQGLGKTVSTIALILKERPTLLEACNTAQNSVLEIVDLDDDPLPENGVMKKEFDARQDTSRNGKAITSVNSSVHAKGRPSAGNIQFN